MFLLTIAGFFIVLFFMVLTGLFGRVPSVEELGKIQNYIASEIYSSDNVLLGRYYIQNRTNVDFSHIPESFTNALIATEDVRFFDHHGVDQRSIFRVLIKSIFLQKESSGGGSTLSQQLAKNLYPRRYFLVLTMPINKFREIIIAIRLEKAYSKTDILELYLNTVSFGENTYGIETAAYQFFKKHPEELYLEESALLVGMLKATSLYNPHLHPEDAMQRRNIVLSQMAKYGYLDSYKADSVKKLPVRLHYTRITHNEGPAPYFREHLRLELVEWFNNNTKPDGNKYNIYTDGLKIYTTINADLQRYAEEAIKIHMKYLQDQFDRQWGNKDPWSRNDKMIVNEIKKSRRYKSLEQLGKTHDEIMKTMHTPVRTEIFTWNGRIEKIISPVDSIKHYCRFLQCGLLAMEAKTGYVRAWVGGIDHRYFRYDHVKARRQPGSVFKPFVYAAALENGRNPCDYIGNDSIVYEEYDNWTPGNADGVYGGYYSMKGGLAHSVNTVSVSILMDTGFDKVQNLMNDLGISRKLPEVPSLALGTAEVSLYELIQAYSIFNNKGKLVKPVYLRRIEDQSGKIIYEQKPVLSEKEIITPGTAEIITEMLKSAVNSGTASSLRSVYGLDSDIAGKTGTTQLNTDGWFIGYTPDLIAGVWVGGDHPVIRFRTTALGQGSHSAMPVWARFMQKIYRDPLYKFSRFSKFKISEDVLAELDCPDYKEQQFDSFKDMLEEKGETIIELIKRIFKKKEKKTENEDK
ncbi:MAG: PBP1A family penicillin-binding protein [Bacteroidales bacterium]|nr:PBP1A family penicillin-binding protein [Bacteroidales bacterium]